MNDPIRLPCSAWRLGAAAAVVALAGCSGSSSPPSPPPPAASLSLSGTAATGAALAAATVDVKCAAGTASGTTAANGSFTISVPEGRLPCVLRVTAGGTALHSAAAGSGSSARANLTPATELIVARHALGTAAAYWSAFGAGAAASLTEAALATAQSDVVALLQGAGVDFSALGNLLTAALTAAAGGTAGDAYDRALDALAGAMASSGTTLATLADTAVAAASGTGTAALPPELLLQPQATGCSALRSATYRLVSPTPGAPSLADQLDTLVFDAAAMRGTRADGSTATWSSTAPCRFIETGTGYTATVTVSQAGVMVGVLTRGSVSRLFWGVPQQARTLAELAGTWNQLGLVSAGTVFQPQAGTATIDATGRFTGGTSCGPTDTWSIDSCTVVPDSVVALLPPFRPAADGGFEVVDSTGQLLTRAFAYRAGSGDLVLLTVGADGDFGFFAPDKPVPLLEVGRQVTNFNFDLGNTLVPRTPVESSYTVVSNDPAARSWTRVQTLTGSTTTFPNTVLADNPRRGYARRLAGSTTGSNGSTVNYSEFSVLRLHGMGVSPSIFPASRTAQLSVTQP